MKIQPDTPLAANHRQRAVRSLAWTTLESAGLSGLSLLTLVVFSRYLTPAQFGVASIALGIVQLLNIPVEKMFHDPIVQRRELSDSLIGTAHTSSMILGCVLTLICWFGEGLVSRAAGEADVGMAMKWMGLSLLFMGGSSVLIALHRRNLQFKELALRSLSGRLVAALTGIAVAMLGYGVWSFISQQVLMVGLAALTLIWLSPYRLHWRFDWKAARELLQFGIPSTAYMLVALANQRLFLFLLGALQGPAAAGYFALAFRATDMLRDIAGGAVSQIAFPLFSQLQGDASELRYSYQRAIRLVSAAMFPTFAGLAAVAPELVSVVFGVKWSDAWPLVVLMAFLTFQFFPRMFATPLLSAVGRPMLPTISMSIQAMFLLVAMLLFGRASIYWAAAIWAIRLLISTPIDMYLLKRVVGIGYWAQWKGALTPALAALLMAGAVLVAKTWLMPSTWSPLVRLALSVPLGMAAYPGFLLLIDKGLVSELVAVVRVALHRR